MTRKRRYVVWENKFYHCCPVKSEVPGVNGMILNAVLAI
jgi:hypothetical protein